MISPGIRLMLMASVFFAIMNFLVKWLDHIPSYEIVFFRCLISLVITIVMLKRLNISLLGKQKFPLILRGVFGITALVMYFTTLQQLPLATAVTVQYLSPIFTTLLGIWIIGEHIKWWQLIFFSVSFAGVVMLKGFNTEISTTYFFMGIAAAIFSALAYNMVRKIGKKEHPLVIVLYFPLIGLPVTLIMCFNHFVWPNGFDWLILLLIGIFTQLAQVNMTKALQLETLAKISAVRYLGVLYALLLGTLFFGETYNLLSIIGIGLVILGLLLNILVKGRTKKKNTFAANA